jgi:hypothetical protein
VKILKAILVIVGTVLCGAADAAVTTNAVVYPQLPNVGKVQFLQGTDAAGTYKTLYTAGTNGSICFGMWMTNSEASTTHVVTIQVVNGAVKYGGAAPTTVAGAGFGSTVALANPQSVIGSAPAYGLWTGLPVDANGNNFLALVSGDTIQATFTTAFVTTGAAINLRVDCNDF